MITLVNHNFVLEKYENMSLDEYRTLLTLPNFKLDEAHSCSIYRRHRGKVMVEYYVAKTLMYVENTLISGRKNYKFAFMVNEGDIFKIEVSSSKTKRTYTYGFDEELTKNRMYLYFRKYIKEGNAIVFKKRDTVKKSTIVVPKIITTIQELNLNLYNKGIGTYNYVPIILETKEELEAEQEELKELERYIALDKI